LAALFCLDLSLFDLCQSAMMPRYFDDEIFAAGAALVISAVCE
jgi:hypothetical protein